MGDLFTTIIISSVLVILALFGFAIGWLLTGRSKIKPGACGRDPKSCDDSKTTHCSLCDDDKK